MAKNSDDDKNVELGRKAAEIEAAARKAQRYRRADYWLPYPKQREFFDFGARHRERALFAGSQLGKTEAAAFELACHLTGLYPSVEGPSVRSCNPRLGGRRVPEDDPGYHAAKALW